MGRVNISRVVLNNFRTFKGRHEVELTDSGLTIVKGDNHDTRGQSGAGKTNILLGIAFVFRFCPYPANALQCWETDAPMSVEVHMDTDEGPAVLVRGEKLSLTVNGKKVSGSAKAVEERLDRLCGANADLREILTYRDQRKPKRFLSMRDAELKEFLTTVLGLGGLEKEIEDSVKRLTGLTAQVDHADQMVTVAAGQLEERESEVGALDLIDLTTYEARVSKAAKVHGNLKTRRVSVQEALGQAQATEVAQLAQALAGFDTAPLRSEEALIVASFGEYVPDTSEQDRLTGLLKQCEAHLEKLQADEKAKIQAWETENAALQKKARQLHNQMAQIPTLIDDNVRLKREIEHLTDSKCPTCERTWDKAILDLHRRTKLIEENEVKLAAAREAAAQAAILDEELRTRSFEFDQRVGKLKVVQSNLREQLAAEVQKQKHGAALHNAQLTERCAEVRAKIAKMEMDAANTKAAMLCDPSKESVKLAEELRQVESMLVDALQAFNQARSDLTFAKKQNEANQQYHDRLLEHVDTARQKLVEHTLKANEVKQIWKQESDYLDLLRGFRNKIFDEVLEAIGTEASAIVGGLPNAQHISIEFRSEHTTGAGTVKNEIKPVVFIHGTERPLASSVSGGQYTSIELAVDLAVIRVISQRLGTQLNWLVLDESFNGHDPITKEMCLTLLQQYAADKLVLIVDHTSEFKELFQRVITVEYENKLSRIKEEP